MRKILLTLGLYCCVLFANAQQPGSIDLGFMHPVPELSDSSRFDGEVLSMIALPGGEYLAAGKFIYYDSLRCRGIVKLYPNGCVDLSFKTGIGIDTGGVYSMALQKDNKIVLGGTFKSYNGHASVGLVRLNADGTYDSTFTVAGFDDYVNSVTVDTNNKILVGGGFAHYGLQACGGIVSLNENGSMNGSFVAGTGFNNGVARIVMLPDNNLLVMHRSSYYNNKKITGMVRLFNNGIRDTTFNLTTTYNTTSPDSFGYINNVIPLGTGKYLVATTYDYNYHGSSVYRLLPDGTIDRTYKPVIARSGGTSYYDYADMIIQPDKKVIVFGLFITVNGKPNTGFFRVNEDGSVDTTFNRGNSFSTRGALDFINAVVIGKNNRIVIGGKFPVWGIDRRHNIAEVDANGDVIYSFMPTRDAYSGITSVTDAGNGKMYLGGYFPAFESRNYFSLIRVNNDGSIDESFNTNNGFFPGVSTTNSVIVQPDHKVLVAGGFGSFGNKYYDNILRLNSDGSLDTTFKSKHPFGFSGGDVNVIALQKDGKIIAGGKFDSYNNIPRNKLLRLNADGTLDTTFKVGSGFDYDVMSLYLYDDGRIMVGGSFFKYNGKSQKAIVRLNADGSVDNSFSTGTGMDGIVYQIMKRADDKLVLVGTVFHKYNGVVVPNGIIRVYPDGTLDTTYNKAGTAFDSNISAPLISSAVLQSDNKVIVTGLFKSYDSDSVYSIIRINADGSRDKTFITGKGFDGFEHKMMMGPDGKLVVVGGFEKYDTYHIKHAVRLFTGALPVSSVKTVTNTAEAFEIYPNPSTGDFTIKLPVTLMQAQVEISDLTGKVIYSAAIEGGDIKHFHLAGVAAGMYLVKVTGGSKVYVSKILIE